MKKFIVFILSMIMLLAISVSWYNVSANKAEMRTNQPENLLNTGETIDLTAAAESPELIEITETPVGPAATPVAGILPSESTDPLESNLPETAANAPQNFQRKGGQTNLNSASVDGFSQELSTISGIVSTYTDTQLTLTTSDGQNFIVQMGNLTTADGTALNLLPGEQVTVTGWYNTTGSLTANQVINHSTGLTYSAKKQSGRPDWAGKGQGNQNK